MQDNTFGAPISCHPSIARRVATGVSSDGLTTPAAPAARAGTALASAISSGTFHGQITPTTG